VNDNEQIKLTPDEEPEPSTATLNIKKFVTCEDVRDTSVPSVQQGVNDCNILTGTISEDKFDISVSGTDINPVPYQFLGSEIGQNVVLGTGPYTVTETPAASVNMEIDLLKVTLGFAIAGPSPSIYEDCIQVSQGSFSAAGTIAVGDSQTCEIINHFVIRDIT